MKAVYAFTADFPKQEPTAWWRRAAISIPADIAEGFVAEVKLKKHGFSISPKAHWNRAGIT
jgi:hypothetical protein